MCSFKINLHSVFYFICISYIEDIVSVIKHYKCRQNLNIINVPTALEPYLMLMCKVLLTLH